MSDDDSDRRAERPRPPARRAYWFRPVDDDGVVDIGDIRAHARAETQIAEALVELLIVASCCDRAAYERALGRLSARGSWRLLLEQAIAALIEQRRGAR
jgi:hypothetical protein